MRVILAVLLLLSPLPARSDVADVILHHAAPGAGTFAEAAQALDRGAQADCRSGPLHDLYGQAADAWMRIAHLRLGPSEVRGRSQAIFFWPDPKNSGGRAQADLIRAENPVIHDAEAFGKISVAVRGFAGLERLLFAADAPQGDYPCALVRAVTADLARNADAIALGWTGDFAKNLLTAGEEGNQSYLSPTEARQALFTQLVTGLGFNADQRLARPLGTEDRPMPERAEMREAGRSLRNIEQSLSGLLALAESLSPESTGTAAAIKAALAQAVALVDDPALAGVADPAQRPLIVALQAAVLQAREVALAEMAPALGVDLGFNAADGD